MKIFVTVWFSLMGIGILIALFQCISEWLQKRREAVVELPMWEYHLAEGDFYRINVETREVFVADGNIWLPALEDDTDFNFSTLISRDEGMFYMAFAAN